MATKSFIEKLTNHKCVYDEYGFCHSFIDLDKDQVKKLLTKVSKEIYGVELVFFSKFKDLNFSWKAFSRGNRRKYKKFKQDTMRIDSEYEIESFYYPCLGNTNCTGYLFIPIDRTSEVLTEENSHIVHELSHLIFSGKLAAEQDYGYHGYTSSGFVNYDKENVTESIAIVFTYILGSFLGVYKPNHSLEEVFNKEFLLDEDKEYLLTILKVIRELGLIDDNLRPNFMVSTKAVEQVAIEMNSYINS